MNKSYMAFAGLVAAMITTGCGSASPKPEATAATATTFPAVLPVMTGTPTAAQVLKFSPASVDAITAGTKTSTTRKFRLVATGPIQATDGKRTMTLTVTSVTNKPFGELTEDDAKTDGSVTLATLQDHLKHDYPGISANEQMTVVRFVAPPK